MSSTQKLLEDHNEEKSQVPASILKELLVEGSTRSTQSSKEDQVPLLKTVTPEAGFCVKTQTSEAEKVFINICWSHQVPSPKDITDEQLLVLLESGDPTQYRVPLSLGEPHTEKDNSGKDCSVYDVVIGSKFFETVQKRSAMKDFLLTIVLEGLEDKYKILLSRDCKIMKNRKFMGLIPEQTVRQKPKPFIIEMESEQPQSMPSKEKSLITELECEKTKSHAPEPQYTILREPAEGDLPGFLVMEVQLPLANSSKQLVLEVGEDRLILFAHPQLYHLALDIPFLVNNEEVGSQFSLDTKILSVTLPVTGVAPI